MCTECAPVLPVKNATKIRFSDRNFISVTITVRGCIQFSVSVPISIFLTVSNNSFSPFLSFSIQELKKFEIQAVSALLSITVTV